MLVRLTSPPIYKELLLSFNSILFNLLVPAVLVIIKLPVIETVAALFISSFISLFPPERINETFPPTVNEEELSALSFNFLFTPLLSAVTFPLTVKLPDEFFTFSSVLDEPPFRNICPHASEELLIVIICPSI